MRGVRRDRADSVDVRLITADRDRDCCRVISQRPVVLLGDAQCH